jgi:hypothetical protein
MTDFVSISEFNRYHVEKCIDLSFNEYFKKIHDIFYPRVDLSIMNYSLELCGRENEFCVRQEKLVEYGLIIRDDFKVALDCMKLNRLEENIDYRVISRPIPGDMNHKEVILKTIPFKMCLGRLINTDKYARYFILQETVYRYYCNYQQEMKDKLTRIKDDQIESIYKQVNEHEVNLNEKIIIEFANKAIERSSSSFKGKSIPSFCVLQKIDNETEFELIRSDLCNKDEQFKEVYICSTNFISLQMRLNRQIRKLNNLIIGRLDENYSGDQDKVESEKEFFTIEFNKHRINVGKGFGAENFIKFIKFVDEEKYDRIEELQY